MTKTRAIIATALATLMTAIALVPSAPRTTTADYDAFVADLADIRGMATEDLFYSGAVDLANNHCWLIEQGYRATHPDDILIEAAAVRWVCPQ